MPEALQQIVQFLETLAGELDMASIQINSEGHVILRKGLNPAELLTIAEFVKLIPD